MKTIIHRADERGEANYGWLKTHYSFSFASWFDAERMNFGMLRVLNDDTIDPGQGFSTHPHENMEIITIPLEGQLAHKDNGGNSEVIRRNEVQVMSAGTGVLHSEFNASDTEQVKLLQIWILPRQMNIPPRYDQKEFDPAERTNAFQTVVSYEKDTEALWINQHARLSLANIDRGASIAYNVSTNGNGVYFFLIKGSATIANEQVQQRDAIGVWETDSIAIEATEPLELLAIEIPMN